MYQPAYKTAPVAIEPNTNRNVTEVELLTLIHSKSPIALCASKKKVHSMRQYLLIKKKRVLPISVQKENGQRRE